MARPRRRSVRARVTVGALLVTAAVLTATGIGTLFVVRSGLLGAAQDAATAEARSVATLAQADELPQVLRVGAQRTMLLQVVRPDGTVIAASPHLRGMSPLGAADLHVREPTYRTVRVASAQGTDTYRMLALPTKTPQGAVVVLAAVSLSEMTSALLALGKALAVGLAVALIALTALTLLVVQRALRPVEQIREEVDTITRGDLSRRIAVPGAGDEITRLAVTMNRLLGRLETETASQQRFIADASHEIRNPIASIRTQLEIARAHPDATDWPGLTGDLLTDTLRLQDLAANLLLLAKLDAATAAGQHPTTEPVPVSPLVQHLLKNCLAAPGSVTISAQVPGELAVQANRQQLEQVLSNLCDNALRHATDRVSITARVEAGPGPRDRNAVDLGPGDAMVRIEVSNDGPPIETADRERLFERFVRLDGARDRDSGGAGLGLAIAREIARAHGGELTVCDAPDYPTGASFVLTLPAAAEVRTA